METEILSTALDKLKGLGPEDVPELSEHEARALSGYLHQTAAAAEVTAAEQLLCRHIRTVLQARAVRSQTAASKSAVEFRRSNNALRAAIDLFLASDFAHVQERDVLLLRETEAALQKMAGQAEPSPNQIRLGTLVTRCLANYSAWVANQPRVVSEPAVPVLAPAAVSKEVPSPVSAPAPGAGKGAAPEVWHAADLLAAAGPREMLDMVEGVPMSMQVRRVEHEGDLELADDCPDSIMLVVRDGRLTARGALSGVIVVDGDIDVTGNVQGGWVFARRGRITANRVLSASSLIAPRGDLVLSSVENATRLYSGGNCQIKESGIGMSVFANDLRVGGTIRNARMHVRGRLEAGAVEMSPRDDTVVCFRAAQCCADYGRPLPGDGEQGLRQLARLYFRCHTTSALIHFFELERLSICRARLLGLQAEADATPVLRAFRGGHAVYSGMQYITEICESLKEAYALGESLGGDYVSQLMRPVLEEALTAVGHLTRETAGMGKEYVASTELLESPCRHINSFAKKLKDVLRQGTGAEKLFFDMDVRLDEWREVAVKERVQYSSSLPAFVEVLGEAEFAVTDCNKLTSLAAHLEGKVPETRMRSVEMRTLKQKDSQYASAESQWRETAATLRQEYTAAVTAAAAALDLVLARRGDRGLRVGEMAYGVPIRTLDVCSRVSGRDGTAAILTEGGSPFALRCENLRLYRDSGGGQQHD